MDVVVHLILIAPSDLNVTTAESFNLMCTASGHPMPSISWTHNGTAVNQNDRLQIITVEESSSRTSESVLIVSTSTASDSGKYTCIASQPVSDFQTVSSRPVTVLIQGRCTSVMSSGSLIVFTDYVYFLLQIIRNGLRTSDQ